MKVSLIKQENYELESLILNIEKSLNNIINPNEIFCNNKKVLIKVNAVSYMKQDLAYTTNPIFLKALIKVLKKYDVDIYVGDNPPFKSMIQVLKGNGMFDVITSENVKLIDNTICTDIKPQKYLKFNEFNVSKNFIDCDILINLPKLKTHSLSYLSCAQKNLFGTIYGLKKADWHVKANDPYSFGCMINDLYVALCEQFKPNHLIHLCDGIVALEKDGPTTGGEKCDFKAILASTSALALDYVALKISQLELSKSFITDIGIKNKIDNFDINDLLIVGDSVNDFNKQLIPPTKPIKSLKILEKQIVKNILLEHPIIDHNKCIKCGSCAKICPPQTMKINNSFPKLNPNKCIRCWCCSEVCPVCAIEKSKRPILGKIIFKSK